MKTIYFYGIDNNIGGMEVYAFNLIKNVLSKTKEFKFHIISQFKDFSFKKELVEDYGCEYSIVPSRKKHPFKYSKEILKILKNAEKDSFLQLNIMSYRNIFLLHAVKKSKIKTVIVGHSTNTDNKLNYLIHKIGRKFYSKLGLKIGNNIQIIKYLGGKDIKNYKIIELGIDKEHFKFNKEKRELIRKKYNVSEDCFMVGQIGRISNQKNQIFSSRVFEEIKDKNIQLFCFGKTIYTKPIKYVEKHQINNVHFIGEITNINEIYSAFDLFIFPSKFESAGLVLYEALENGCPSVISDNVPTDGIKSNCMKIRKLNVKEWKNLIELAHQEKWQRDFNSKTPSHEEQINGYIDLYKSL